MAGAVRFDVPPNRNRPRRAAIIGTAFVLLLAVASYLIYHSFQQVSPPPDARGPRGAFWPLRPRATTVSTMSGQPGGPGGRPPERQSRV